MWHSAVRFRCEGSQEEISGRKLAQNITKLYVKRIVSPGWLSVKGAWRLAKPLTMSSLQMSQAYGLNVTEGFAFGRKVCRQN